MSSSWQLGWDALGSIAGLVSLVLYIFVEWDKLKSNKALRNVASFLIILAIATLVLGMLRWVIASGGIPYFAMNTSFLALAGAQAYWFAITKLNRVRGKGFAVILLLIGGIIHGWVIGMMLSEPMGSMGDWEYYWLTGAAISWVMGWLVINSMKHQISITTTWLLGGLLGGAYIYTITWMFTIIGYGDTFAQGATFITMGLTIWILAWLSIGFIIQIKNDTLNELLSGWGINALLMAVLGGLYVWLIPWNITWIAVWFIFWTIGWLLGGWLSGALTTLVDRVADK